MYPKNTESLIRRFKHQLTDYMPIVKTQIYSEPFYKYEGKDCYGRDFIVKKHKVGKTFALFIKKSYFSDGSTSQRRLDK